MASREPARSRCVARTAVTTPIDGRASAASSGDVAGHVHAHLEHRDLVLGSEPQQRQRQADLVVLVALVAQHRPARRQHLGDLLLGGRLGERSRDAHHERVEPVAPRLGRAPERRARVVDRDHAHARPEGVQRLVARRLSNDECRGARSDRVTQESVAVRAFAGQREKGVSSLNAPRIDCAAPDRQSAGSEERAAHGRSEPSTVKTGSLRRRRGARQVGHDCREFSHGVRQPPPPGCC